MISSSLIAQNKDRIEKILDSSLILSGSQINAFTSCKAKWFFSTICRLEPKVPSSALEFGRLIHLGLATLAKDGVEKAKKVFTREYEKSEIKDKNRTLLKGLSLIENYPQAHPKESFSYVEIEPTYEMEVAVGAHPRMDIRYKGRLDGIIKEEEIVRVIEHKTTSRIGYTFFDKFNFDYQIEGYYALCLEEFKQCDGVLVDALRVTKQSKIDLLNDYARHKVVLYDFDMRKWKEEISNVAKEMRWCLRTKTFTHTKPHCGFYGKCEFKELCMYGERVIPISYKNREEN